MEIRYIQSSGWQNTDSHGVSTLWSTSGSGIVTNCEGLLCTGMVKRVETAPGVWGISHLPQGAVLLWGHLGLLGPPRNPQKTFYEGFSLAA